MGDNGQNPYNTGSINYWPVLKTEPGEHVDQPAFAQYSYIPPPHMPAYNWQPPHVQHSLYLSANTHQVPYPPQAHYDGSQRDQIPFLEHSSKAPPIKAEATEHTWSETYSLEFRLAEIKSTCRENHLAEQLLKIEAELADKLMRLNYGPKVTHIYNPVDYAYKPHMMYYKQYCNATAKVVMVGMNPGPFGMAQTGVPFGEVESVIQWLGIREEVASPSKLHHKRPITGFECTRKEVSGTRLWGFFRENFESPNEFFRDCFIYNHCPLVFMGPSGKNVTPAQLSSSVRTQLNDLCDVAMYQSIQLFPECHTLIGIGRFAEERIKKLCEKYQIPHTQGYLMHPSPRNPTANREWDRLAKESLIQLGIISPHSANQPVSDPPPDLEVIDKAKRKLFLPPSDSVEPKRIVTEIKTEPCQPDSSISS